METITPKQVTALVQVSFAIISRHQWDDDSLWLSIVVIGRTKASGFA